MSRGQRAKGNAAEREVAAIIQAVWERVEPGCRFVRTPLSGGWGSGADRSGFNASGDLMTTAKLWPFCVEVKRREGWTPKTLFAGRASPVWGWWQQTCEAADNQNAEPLLVFRRNGEPWRTMMWHQAGKSRVRYALKKHGVVLESPIPLLVGSKLPIRAWSPVRVMLLDELLAAMVAQDPRTR